MPIESRLFNNGSVISTRFTGRMTETELVDFLFQIVNSVGSILPHSYRQLIDARDLEEIELSEQGLRRIAHINQLYGSASPALTKLSNSTTLGKRQSVYPAPHAAAVPLFIWPM